MFEYGNGSEGSGWWLMMVGMLLFWGLASLVLIVVIRYLRGTEAPTRSTDAAAILAERFARGELTDEEYVTKSAMLGNRR